MDPTLITESFRQSSPISKLADDLLQQILIRLPNPRVACLCKLVCKPWSSLISGPRFNRLFVSHHKSMSHAPMPDDPFELQSTICSFLPPVPTTVRNSLRVLDCNKDLVLCGFWDLDSRSGESSRSYLVCNPFTKQWIALPLAPMRHYPHYESRVSRLVCEPRISVGLDLGDRDRTFTYTEHRFRVVCLYQGHSGAITLDVFCSESGEWTKDAFFWGTCDRIRPRSVVSCNGELFLKYLKYADDKVDGFNPFRLDMPPVSIDVSAFLAKHRWFISNSRGGALHVIALESETPMLPARASVWRLGEDRKSWRKQCEGLMMMSSNYELAEEGCFEPFLHPHKPELVFFSRVAHRDYMNDMMCCDLGRESSEVELFAALERWDDVRHLQVFQPRVSCCWATPLIIPRCKQQPFQGVCGTGSGGFWADESMCCSSEAAAECPSLHFLNNW
ncbi:unnamed protein product [Linum tenue]|uniref:F-box domain-containing protein n=1 Tax=Linum tenue TaxID=586396 RepID=A0AAV0N3L0_9ROSI|nr:unnamed protein product [Linum tenue]